MGLSRNKVAVPEGAAGSPPFYGEFQDTVPCPVCAPCAWNGSTVPCGDAGVEEIGGLDGPVPSGSGMGVLLGSRTATPQWFPLWRGSDAHAGWPASVGRVAERVARGGLRTG